jgi:hypothetical protein
VTTLDPSRVSFLVENHVPIPPRQNARVARYGARKYPWAEMQEGDSFLVPGQPTANNQIRVNSAAHKRSLAYAGEHYVTRAVSGGVRVWRVPASAIEAATAGETAQTGSTEGESAVRDSGDAQ